MPAGPGTTLTIGRARNTAPSGAGGALLRRIEKSVSTANRSMHRIRFGSGGAGSGSAPAATAAFRPLPPGSRAKVAASAIRLIDSFTRNATTAYSDRSR